MLTKCNCCGLKGKYFIEENPIAEKNLKEKIYTYIVNNPQEKLSQIDVEIYFENLCYDKKIIIKLIEQLQEEHKIYIYLSRRGNSYEHCIRLYPDRKLENKILDYIEDHYLCEEEFLAKERIIDYFNYCPKFIINLTIDQLIYNKLITINEKNEIIYNNLKTETKQFLKNNKTGTIEI